MRAHPIQTLLAVASRHPLWSFLLLYALLAIVLLSPTIHGNDGHANYAYLRSLLFDGDFDFRNDYALYDQRTNGRFSFASTPIEPATGRPGNRYGIGSSLLWAPFVVPVRLADLIRHSPATGLENRYVWAVGVASAFWGGAGLLALLLLCMQIWGIRGAGMATAAAILLSPLPVYLFFHTAMSHATAFFATTTFLAAWIMALRSFAWRWFIIGGIAAGLAVTVRIQDAIVIIAAFAIAAIVCLLKILVGQKRLAARLMIKVFCAGLISLLVFSPQMLAWKLLYGSFFSGPAPYLRYSEFDLLRPVHAAETLFSSNHGLFFWHPMLAIGLLALLLDLRRKRLAPLILLLAFLATWHLVSCWQVWHAGASFGNRFYLSILISFAAGWAVLADRWRSKRALPILIAILILGAIWNAGLAIQYGTGMIPHQGAIRFTTLLRNQFTLIRK